MKNVLLIFGGNSPEHEISCKSAKSILENIDKNLFSITAVGISHNNNWYIFKDKSNYLDGNWLFNDLNEEIHNIIEFIRPFDIVFPIIHGTTGEDGKLQGFLDLFNIPYIGSNTKSSANGLDKALTKLICNYVDIPQISYQVINNDNSDFILDIDYPVIIKPANGGSSIGISVANNERELNDCLNIAFKYDNKVIIEKYIKALELECAILEKDNNIIVSSIGQIISCNQFYDYEAKYIKESQTIVPANISELISDKIKVLASKVFKALEAKDLARIDFLYDEDNDIIYFNEINTLPGFTNISMYPKLLIYDGISYQDIITALINNNLKMHN